jgi:hypothetical protein
VSKAEQVKYLIWVGQLGCTWSEQNCSNPSCVDVLLSHIIMGLVDMRGDLVDRILGDQKLPLLDYLE